MIAFCTHVFKWSEITLKCEINERLRCRLRASCTSTWEASGSLAEPHDAALFRFPSFRVYAVSVSFVSKCLFTRLPVINDGEQVFLKCIRDSF